MKKEESIKKTDEIINHLKMTIVDIENCKEHFIDFYDNVIDIDSDENLLGVMKHGSMLNLLFCPKFPVYTKTICYKEYKNRKRTELIDDVLKK